MSKWRALLQNYNDALEQSGETKKCYSLSDRTVYLLRGLLQYIGWKTRYEGNEQWTDSEVREIEQWKENAEYELSEYRDCDAAGSHCVDYPPTDARIVYFPQNPHTQPDYVPEGYLHPPFYVIEPNDLEIFLGARIGDVLLDFQSMLFEGFNLYNLVPSIRIEVEGKGELEIHLLQIVQGGLAALTVDDNLLNTYFVDLTSMTALDFSSWTSFYEILFPQFSGAGLFSESIQEFTFDTEGTHSVEVRFLPKIATDVIVGLGGGFRKITWCPMTFDPCCPETIEINYTTYRNQQIVMQQYQSLIDDGDTGASFGAPENFDSDPADTGGDIAHRSNALCRVVGQYIGTVLYNAAAQQGAAASVAAQIAQWLPFLAPLPAVISEAIQDIATDVLQGLVNDCAAIAEVKCCMIGSLQGQSVTKEAIATSLANCGFDFGSNAAQIAYMVHVQNQNEANQRAFISQLKSAFSSAKSGTGATENDCSCECCDSGLVLYDWAGTGCIITHMGDCIYKFYQPVPAQDGHYYMSVRDEQNRCFDLSLSPSETYPSVGVGTDTHVYYCDGQEWHGVGGFDNTNENRVRWRQASNTNYFKVELHVSG